MNVNFEKIDNVNAKISIAFVEDDYKDEVKKQLNELGRTRPIKGFRPGHVPSNLLKKIYGNQVTAQVIDRILSKELNNYITENKIAILGEPLLDKDTKVDIEHNTEFEFKFDLGLQPEINLTADKDIVVPYYNIQVSQDMIDRQNEGYRRRYGKQVPGDEAAEDSLLRGSLTELDEEGNDKADGIRVEKTVLSPMYLKDADEKAKFVGAQVGTEVVYNPFKSVDGNLTELAALLEVDKEQADVKSDFRFDIKEIMVNALADMDQEFFDNVLGRDQAKNEGEYFDKLRDIIAAEMKNESNHRFAVDVEKVLREKTGDLEMPDEFLKRMLKSQNKEQDEHKIEEQYPETRSMLQWQLIKNHLAKQCNVQIDQDDMMRFAHFLAASQFAQYGMTNLPDDVIDNYAKKIMDDEKYRDEIADRAFTDKLYGELKNRVTLDEKDVTIDEFNRLYEASSAE